METFRIFLATFLFSISAYLLYDIFANGFSWYLLLAATIGFLLIHPVWPKRRTKTEDNEYVDYLEFVVELPYRAIAAFFRSLGRIGRDADGLDIDL